MNGILLVIIPDRLSDLIRKGEITDRYYNPGNLFDEVHILMTNDDQPNPEVLQRTVGHARLHLHNLPVPSSIRTLGWQPPLLKDWLDAGLRLAQKIQPTLIRAYGNYHNGYLAVEIKKRFGTPVVVSLHTHMDLTWRRSISWWDIPRHILYRIHKRFEREALSNADRVIIVYESLRDYAIKNGARDVRLIYNVVNPKYLYKKTDYQLHCPPRIVSVGNQFKLKNPENIIRALSRLDALLTLIGDGPYHGYLETLAKEIGVKERVKFIKAMPNDELCASLASYDIFAVHTDAVGIPKAVIEPLLVGLPVVINHNSGVPELEGNWVLSVENSADGYREGIERLLVDEAQRRLLGQRGYQYAQERFLPHVNEQKLVSLYIELLSGSNQ